MHAGKLNERVTLLALTETAGGFAYSDGNTVYAQATAAEKKTIVTARTVGTSAAQMVFRSGSAPEVMQALRWRDELYMVTSATQEDRLWTKVTAGKVQMFDAVAQIYSGGEISFPAVLLERYIRQEEGRPMTVSAESYVLITPKKIALEHADLVSFSQLGIYHVDVVHRLDPHMNEYEISRRVDR